MIIQLDVFEPPPRPAPSPLDAFDQFVTAPAAAAAAAPSAAAPAPEVNGASATPEAARNAILRIVLGLEEKRLRCTQDDVSGFVRMSYVAGGFPMVIAAREAIERAVGGLADDLASAEAGVKELEKLATNHDQKRSADRASKALPAALENTNKARTALINAQAYLPVYSEYFRRAWNAIAAYEEVLLRQYDGEVREAFRQIAAANRKLAESEWTKYAPLDESEKPLSFGDPKANQAKKVALNPVLIERLLEERPEKTEFSATSDERRALAQEEMWRRALELYRRAKSLQTNRNESMRLTEKEDKKEAENRAKRMTNSLIEWNRYRKEIADQLPVLLKIYPFFKSGNDANDKRATFGQEIIDALVSVRDECDRIDREALRIWAKADRLRIVPEAVDRTNPDVGGFALPTAELNRSIGSSFLKRDIPLQSILDAMHLKAATHFGLTIPVSEIFAALLKNDSDLRKNTGWLHAPAGLHLMNRARSEPKLEPFFQPGSLAHVAVSQVLDRLASQRERDKTLESRGIILMWGMATLLAFFTNGATLYAAAIVQAAFSANEIYDSVVEYQQDAALAAVSLAAIEEAGWRRPSTINLVRLIVADASDIVQGTIGIKGLPLVLDLWLGAFALIHPDDTPSRR